MQISLNGLQNKHSLPSEFPYDAINPMTAQTQTFNSMDDVYKTLEECYEKCVEKGYSRLGEALYSQSLFVVNDILLLNIKMQEMIKNYKFCKSFNCSPAKSLNDTPIKIIDSFMIIDEEINQFRQKEQ